MGSNDRMKHALGGGSRRRGSMRCSGHSEGSAKAGIFFRIFLMCIALVVVAFMMTYVMKLVEGEREVEVVVEEKGRFWDENGIYWGRYYGTIAHGFDKPVYKTCKASSTATANSDQPSPSFFDDFMAAFCDFLQGFGMGLLYHWWSGSDIVNIATIYKGINFAVKMTLAVIQLTFIKSADFTTFYTIKICQQIQRKLGLPV